jgi:hypothetical protein
MTGRFRPQGRNSAAIGPFRSMVSISITVVAYEAIRSTFLDLPGTPPGPDGMIKIWLDPKFADRLAAMRGQGESYSDVILRLAKANP